MPDLITSVADAVKTARTGAWFWARVGLASEIEQLLPKPWYSLRHGEVYNGELAACFIHPVRMQTLLRRMESRPVRAGS